MLDLIGAGDLAGVSKYMNGLVMERIIPETRAQILKIVGRMIAEDEIQGLILGGLSSSPCVNQARLWQRVARK
jgi:hypothetical protein